MFAAADAYFRSTMTAKDRQQQSAVDGVLRLVERTLSAQHEVRQAIVDGRVRVDQLVSDALLHPEDEQKPE